MVRGTQKQIIHLKNPESPLFEEAFLIVKSMPRSECGSRSMVEEANRLLTEQYAAQRPPLSHIGHGRYLRAALFFLTGALAGVLITVLCLL